MNINEMLTTADLQEMFGVTAMTIYNWRKRGLPEIVIPGRAKANIRFDPASVNTWAEQHQVKVKVPLEKLTVNTRVSNVRTNTNTDKAPAT